MWTYPHLVDTKISEEYNRSEENDGKERQRTVGIPEGIQSRNGTTGTEAWEAGMPGSIGFRDQRKAIIPVDTAGLDGGVKLRFNEILKK
jgi:hypothetical protein